MKKIVTIGILLLFLLGIGSVVFATNVNRNRAACNIPVETKQEITEQLQNCDETCTTQLQKKNETNFCQEKNQYHEQCNSRSNTTKVHHETGKHCKRM